VSPFVPSGPVRALGDGEAAMLAAECAAMEPFLALGFSATGLANYLRRPDPGCFRFAIGTDTAPAGVLVLRWPWLRGPFIELLALLPAAQGRGLGRAVITWAAAEAQKVSANLWATVSDFNAPARAFYLRSGFVEIAELPGLLGEGGSEILLRRHLIAG